MRRPISAVVEDAPTRNYIFIFAAVSLERNRLFARFSSEKKTARDRGCLQREIHISRNVIAERENYQHLFNMDKTQRCNQMLCLQCSLIRLNSNSRKAYSLLAVPFQNNDNDRGCNTEKSKRARPLVTHD